MRNYTCTCVAILLIIGFGCCSTFIVDLNAYEMPDSDLNAYRMGDNVVMPIVAKDEPLHAPTEDLQNMEASYVPNTSDQRKGRNTKVEETKQQIEKLEQTEELKKNPVAQCPRVQRFIVEENGFVGTNIIHTPSNDCFQLHDIAMLELRKNFESIIPEDFPRHLLTDRQVCVLMRYFNRVNHMLSRLTDPHIKFYMQRAFYDTIGGYMRHRLLPAAQISYYAGHLRLITVTRLRLMYGECRTLLNTHGNFWRMPDSDLLEQLRREVKPLKVKTCRTSEFDSCGLLDMHSIERNARNMQMLVALPVLDPENDKGELTNVALPFKHRQVYNLRSPSSAFILVRFYMVLTRCYEQAAMNQHTYNKRFKEWIFERLYLHFDDEMFYPGLGGILRIFENLKLSKKPIEVQGFLEAHQVGDRYADNVDFDMEPDANANANTNYKRNIGFDENMKAHLDMNDNTTTGATANYYDDREDTFDTHAGDRRPYEPEGAADGLDLMHYKSKLKQLVLTQENNENVWLPEPSQLSTGSEVLNAQLPDGINNYFPFLCILLLLLLVLIFYITCSKLYRTGKAPCRRYNRLQPSRTTLGRDSSRTRQQMEQTTKPAQPKIKRTRRNPRNYCIKCYRQFGFRLGFKQDEEPFDDELIVITSDSRSVLPESGELYESELSTHDDSLDNIESQTDDNEAHFLSTRLPEIRGPNHRFDKHFLQFIDEDNIATQSEDSDRMSFTASSDSESVSGCGCGSPRPHLLEWGKRSVNNIKSSYDKLSARNPRFNTT